MDTKLQALEAELIELQRQLQDPAVFGQPDYPKLAKRQKYLEDTLELFRDKRNTQEELEAAQAMLSDSDSDIATMALDEVEALNHKLQTINDKLSEP